MGFECKVHGWQHLFYGCPKCANYNVSNPTANALVEVSKNRFGTTHVTEFLGLTPEQVEYLKSYYWANTGKSPYEIGNPVKTDKENV